MCPDRLVLEQPKDTCRLGITITAQITDTSIKSTISQYKVTRLKVSTITYSIQTTNKRFTKMANRTSAEKRSITNVLNKLECPFKWKIKIRMPPSSLTLLIKEKEEKCDPSGKEFIWMRLTHCIVLTYVHSIDRHYLASLEKINECEDILNEIRQDVFFSDILGGLWYVVKAFKAHIYKQQNNLVEAKSVLSAIKPFSQLENSQKAAVYAIIATCKSVCPVDEVQLSVVLDTINKIVQMDPTRGLWYFLKAQCLKEIRMKGINKFTKEEIRNLETLVRITRVTNSFYLCYTAEEFINIANNLSPSSDGNLYNRAAELYCKVLKNSEHHSLFILSRLLFGYCQLPSHLRTMSIDPIFNKILSIGKEDRDANLAMGAYCEKVTGRNRTALNYYSRALELGSYEAGIAIVKLQQKSYGYCDLFYETTKMREIFKDDPRKQQEILCQLGSNYYSYGYAIGAIYCWHIAATLDPYARELQDHRSWLRPSKKINIYRSLSLEANYALKRIYNWSDLDMKKPAQQQTVKLLQLAVELCSNFYKAEQDKKQTKTERTGKIKDLTTNKNKVPKLKTDEMIVKPHRKVRSYFIPLPFDETKLSVLEACTTYSEERKWNNLRNRKDENFKKEQTTKSKKTQGWKQNKTWEKWLMKEELEEFNY